MRVTEQSNGGLPNGTIIPSIVYTRADNASNGQLTTVGSTVSSIAAVAQKVRMLSNHGRTEKYSHAFEAYNSRLDGLYGSAPKITR